MNEILNELKEIRHTLDIQGRMLETLVSNMDELFHAKKSNTDAAKTQMAMVQNMIQNTPGLKDNPVMSQLFSQFDSVLKDNTNDR